MKINNIIILGGKYMKKMKRLILAVCAALAACCIFHFTGCAGGENGSEEETPMPSATAAVTATPASEPKSPEPTATPEAGPENLLEYAIEDDSLLLGGDSWVAIEESWAGPLQEKRDGCESPAMQEFTETTCSDGEESVITFTPKPRPDIILLRIHTGSPIWSRRIKRISLRCP